MGFRAAFLFAVAFFLSHLLRGQDLPGQWIGSIARNVQTRYEPAPAHQQHLKLSAPPYSYQQIVSIENKAGLLTLAGTLTKPKGPGRFPAVILLTGSGPQGLDEPGFDNEPFRVLADYLTRQGFAVLRCDGRGTGQSTGSFPNAIPPDFLSDASAQLDFLKTRSDIDPQRIGLLGHSEGGALASMLAAQRPGDVAFLVLLAAPGINMLDLLIARDSLTGKAEGATAAQLQRQYQRNIQMFTILRTAPDPAQAETRLRTILKEEGQSEDEIEQTVRFLNNPRLRWYINYEPSADLRRVRCPVLALNGEKDVHVPARTNLTAIEAALKTAHNLDARVQTLPGLNHLFQRCGKCSVSEYGTLEGTFNEEALAVIGGWLKKR